VCLLFSLTSLRTLVFQGFNLFLASYSNLVIIFFPSLLSSSSVRLVFFVALVVVVVNVQLYVKPQTNCTTVNRNSNTNLTSPFNSNLHGTEIPPRLITVVMPMISQFISCFRPFSFLSLVSFIFFLVVLGVSVTSPK
jgi:hypothetical protein